MTLLKSSTCCLNVGSVKWVDGPLELCLLNEILVYKWNFYVFTRELVLINKINMSFAHDWVIINLGQGEWWLGAILCMPPSPHPYSALLITWVRIQCIVDHMGTRSYVSFCLATSVWKDVKSFFELPPLALSSCPFICLLQLKWLWAFPIASSTHMASVS